MSQQETQAGKQREDYRVKDIPVTTGQEHGENRDTSTKNYGGGGGGGGYDFWDPLSLGDLWGGFGGWDTTYEAPRRNQFRPRANIVETDNCFFLCVELPGVRKEDVCVEFNRGRIIITGERHYEPHDQNERYLLWESSIGTFRRSLTIGENVKAENIKAEFCEGMLKLTVPKPEGAKRLKVSIQ